MYLKRLLLWHGRLSYKRSACLSQFVVHRGLIITVNQMIFIIVFYYCSIAIYNGWLMMGYVTVFTCLPVFALILDEDIDVESALKHPPLYKTLQKGRSFSFKILLVWTSQSIYQVFFRKYKNRDV